VSRVPVQNLTCYQGDDWSIQPVFTLVAGTLAGCKLWLTVKADLADADPGLVQIDTTVGGVVIDDATHATFEAPQETPCLPLSNPNPPYPQPGSSPFSAPSFPCSPSSRSR
jgi:hypothetical protein